MIYSKSIRRLAKEAARARLSQMPGSAFAGLGLDRARLASLMDGFKGQMVFPGQPGYHQDR